MYGEIPPESNRFRRKWRNRIQYLASHRVHFHWKARNESKQKVEARTHRDKWRLLYNNSGELKTQKNVCTIFGAMRSCVCNVQIVNSYIEYTPNASENECAKEIKCNKKAIYFNTNKSKQSLRNNKVNGSWKYTIYSHWWCVRSIRWMSAATIRRLCSSAFAQTDPIPQN